MAVCYKNERKNLSFFFFLVFNSELSVFTTRFWSVYFLNILKPTSHVMHHQFNIQELYALPTLYLCVLYLSENKQWLVPLTAQTGWFL